MTTDLTLRKHPSFPGVEGPVLVVVMDGVGIGREDEGDAVWLARTPNLDWLKENACYLELKAHGTAVGLPSDDDMGNSEVGHNALGAGRVFEQGAKLVNLAIEDGSLFEGEPWREAVARVKESGEPLHFIGLLSDGNVHSHIEHLFAMLRRAADDGVERARVHALLDGRDVPETSALEYVDRLEEVLAELSEGDRDYRVASGGGRMKVTMDRYEADWAMVERGWQLHVRGEGRTFPSLREAIETLREETGATDQNLPGFVIADGDAPVGPIRDGASVIFFNFRGDRALEVVDHGQDLAEHRLLALALGELDVLARSLAEVVEVGGGPEELVLQLRLLRLGRLERRQLRLRADLFVVGQGGDRRLPGARLGLFRVFVGALDIHVAHDRLTPWSGSPAS